MSEHLYPLSGGSYRVINGTLVREEDVAETSPKQPKPEQPKPAQAKPDTTPAKPGRTNTKED